MSSQDRRAQRNRRTRAQSRRSTVLNVDLNAAPPGENRDQEGTSIHVESGAMTHGQRGASLTPATIDVEAPDDDVIISSPRAFAAAKNRRDQGRVIVLDVDSEDRMPRGNSRDKRRRVSTNQAMNSGDGLTFSCPVCMGPLVEEMSTKCGHIFCKACIKASIAAQGKCPTCRRKMSMKDTIRVYLPTTS